MFSSLDYDNICSLRIHNRLIIVHGISLSSRLCGTKSHHIIILYIYIGCYV